MLQIYAFLSVLASWLTAHILIRRPPVEPLEPTSPPMPTIPPTVPESEPEVLLWDTPEHARHSLRVICDQEGLTVEQKNTMSQVVHCESGYNIHARLDNKDAQGRVWSSDIGICQWNTYFHGKEITPEESEKDPEKAVRLMCKYVKEGLLKEWVCYSSGMSAHFSA